MPRTLESPFTPAERDLIRLELMPRFGQEPDLANGLFLRIWRAEDPQGDPDDARPRAGEGREESDGSAGRVLHRGRARRPVPAPAGEPGDGPRAVRLSAA